ncbi:MAG: NAD-dependent epimerase/dehydratase family protein [Candidatus Hodarchaeales archaeon]|jgi:UDP-glucose 4-epimerase
MNTLEDKRILVIGGAGFIGSHVVDCLTEENPSEVIIFDNLTRGSISNVENALKDDRVRMFEAGGDIRQIDILNDATKKIDVVFHLAALWLFQCYNYPRSAFEVNVAGTYNVIESCIKNKVKKLVFSSSASVYGDALSIPMTEDHPFNNRTFYGATKIAGEQMCRAFNERYGLDYLGFRYMNVYGERQDYLGTYTSVIMKILDRIDENKPPIIFGDGSQAYDFIHVRDVAKANLLAAKSKKTDEFYNIGIGIKTSIEEICELLLKLTNSDLEIQYEPQGLTFVTNRIGSTEKAERDLGFVAKIDLHEGLKKVINWRKTDKKRRGGNL